MTDLVLAHKMKVRGITNQQVSHMNERE